MYPQWANIPLQGLDIVYWEWQKYHVPTADLDPAIGSQMWFYMVSKKHSGKANQLTLANGGTEHAK